MSSTEAPAAAGILGIDLGKYRPVACHLADDGEIVFQSANGLALTPVGVAVSA